jgi:hypothetical protein
MEGKSIGHTDANLSASSTSPAATVLGTRQCSTTRFGWRTAPTNNTQVARLSSLEKNVVSSTSIASLFLLLNI